MIFMAAATAGGLLGSGAGPLLQSGAYALGRIQVHQTTYVLFDNLRRIEPAVPPGNG